MTYKINGTEFTQKDFRKAGNRETYWIQYADVIEAIGNGGNSLAKMKAEIIRYITRNVYAKKDGNVIKSFDTFLACFVDGDYTKIKEFQETDQGEMELVEVCQEVVRDFFMSSASGEPS